MKDVFERVALGSLAQFAGAFRVVVLSGPRQSGKTWLLRRFQEQYGGQFVTLDDATMLNAALSDPIGFVDQRTPLIVDEVQRGGNDLLLAVKAATDRSDKSGQFILSGSTRFLTVPSLSESLAGRAVLLELWPLSAVELAQASYDAPSALFTPDEFLSGSQKPFWKRDQYLNLFCAGGYPEAVRLNSASLRTDWFDSYVSTVVLRDVATFAQVRQVQSIPLLLRLIAARSGSAMNIADLARSVGLNHATTRDYLSYLDIVYLTASLPVWSANITSRLIKTPKVYVIDSGLAASLLGVDAGSLAEAGNDKVGSLVETFVFSEITKQLTVSKTRANLYYYRDRADREIDFILERRDGSLVGVEVKAGATVRDDSFRHLAWLRDQIGDRFKAGYVLHLGTQTASFGDRLHAAPVSALWGNNAISVL